MWNGFHSPWKARFPLQVDFRGRARSWRVSIIHVKPFWQGTWFELLDYCIAEDNGGKIHKIRWEPEAGLRRGETGAIRTAEKVCAGARKLKKVWKNGDERYKRVERWWDGKF